MKETCLAEKFDQYFSIKFADTDELKNEAYRIRYEVYCEELDWEPANVDKIEMDQCDSYASSLLLKHKATGIFAGTVRLVIPPPMSPESKLPFEFQHADLMQKEVLDLDELPRGSFGELSRMAVRSRFRRRPNEKGKPYVINGENTSNNFLEDERRSILNITIGIYLSMIAMVKMCNHTHVFLVMEFQQKKRFDSLGLHFTQCSREFEHRGIRALFYMERKDFIDHLRPELHILYNMLEENLCNQVLLHPY